MKAENAVRLSDNLVGVEINTIQDVVKAQAAGLELVDKDGWGYDYTLEDDESGEERKPTEQEIFDRINKDLADDKEVYACMTLANGWCVQRNAKNKLAMRFLSSSARLHYARKQDSGRRNRLSFLSKRKFGRRCG